MSASLMMKMLLKENNHQNVFKSIHHQIITAAHSSGNKK